MTEKLGRFGHHPDPAVDFCIEVEALYGMAYDRRHDIDTHNDFPKRLERALEFRVGGDPAAVASMGDLRTLDKLVRENKPIRYPKGWHPKQQSDAGR